MPKPQTISEYIKQAPKESQKQLKEIRKCLKEVTPKAIESLKWSMPAFSYDRILFTYAGFKKHIGFYPTPSVIKEFKKELINYKTAKGSIQFPLDKPLPISLIKKIAKFRVKELKEKDAKWM
ncbi:DUF1801 domain-containing protein [Candidatus Nomurabacteria bacterium]|nr:DUF1801 domain-containing protein [Candidatus Nomurabacteria bacterium]